MSEAVAVYGQPQAAPSAPPAATPAEAPEGAETPADQAPATPQGEQPAQQATDEQPEKSGQSRFERRLKNAYRKIGEREAQVAHERAQREELEKKLAQLQAPTQPQDGEPRLEQFDDIEKYAKAKAEWGKTQALKDYETKQRTESQKQTQKQLVSAWQERVEDAESRYDDFDEVVGTIEPNNPLTFAIMSADNGVDVAYHLGKNLKEANRIAKLDAVRQMIEIGRLSAKLEATPPVGKQPSQAPAPIAPVTGTAQPSTEDLGDADMKSFIRIRNKQLGRGAAKR